MSKKLIRTFEEFDVKSVEQQLLIYGDLSGQCGKCQTMDVKITDHHCPQCKTEFKFIAFRNPKHHMPKIHKIFHERPSLKILDYDDYKTSSGASKAEDFFK